MPSFGWSILSSCTLKLIYLQINKYKNYVMYRGKWESFGMYGTSDILICLVGNIIILK